MRTANLPNISLDNGNNMGLNKDIPGESIAFKIEFDQKPLQNEAHSSNIHKLVQPLAVQ